MPADRAVHISSLIGHVSVLSVPDVLGLLSTLQKTGTFAMWNEREYYRIWIVRGTVVWAQSKTPVPNLMLGQILVAQGAIDQAALEQFIAERPESRSRLGQTLVEAGRIHSSALDRAVTFQAQSIFDRAYAMQNASYRFKLEDAADMAEHGLSVTHLLLESARTSDEASHRMHAGDPPAS